MLESDELVPPGRLRVMQIIAFALVLGVLTFISIAIYVVQITDGGQGIGQPGGPPILSLLALGMLALLAIVSLVLPNALLRQGMRRIARREFQPPPSVEPSPAADAEQILGLRQSTLIISLALIEGPAIFACVAYLLEGRPFVLAVVGLAIGLMLVRFPTQAGVRGWVRHQLDCVEQTRQNSDAASNS